MSEVDKTDKTDIDQSKDLKDLKDEFTIEDYNIIFNAVGSLKISLNDPKLKILILLQEKIKHKAEKLQSNQQCKI